jgi:hypothetical protein
MDGAHLGNGDLEIGKQLEKKGLECFIGAVDFVYQEHRGSVLGEDGFEQRPLQQELPAENVSLFFFNCLFCSFLYLDGQ